MEDGNVYEGHDGDDDDWEEGDDSVCDDQEENDDGEVSDCIYSGEVVEVVFHICKTYGDGKEEGSLEDDGLLALSWVGGLDDVGRSVQEEVWLSDNGHGTTLVDSSGDNPCPCRHDDRNEIFLGCLCRGSGCLCL